MSSQPKRTAATSGAFAQASDLHGVISGVGVADPTLQELNQIRLLLRGDSVIDWHRLDFESPHEVRRLLALNGLDLEDREDARRLVQLRGEGVRYIRETLRLRLDDHVARDVEPEELFLIASGKGRGQRQACLLLKVMHILHHLDARELRTMLAVSDTELFAMIEESVAMMFDELRAANVPVVEFAWSRKTRSSLLTKMLIKKQTSAARVFDRLRFRLIVESHEDLERTLHVMLHRCIPFNYVVPLETVNTLIVPTSLDERANELQGALSGGATEVDSTHNEFSSTKFRMLNFVADLPVRVDDLLWSNNEVGRHRGRVVFVLAEFQVLDRATAEANETGESSHSEYKQRQHLRVKERLFHKPSGHAPSTRPPESEPPTTLPPESIKANGTPADER
jgi:uncharacterized protein (TIGR04552 family)